MHQIDLLRQNHLHTLVPCRGWGALVVCGCSTVPAAFKHLSGVRQLVRGHGFGKHRFTAMAVDLRVHPLLTLHAACLLTTVLRKAKIVPLGQMTSSLSQNMHQLLRSHASDCYMSSLTYRSAPQCRLQLWSLPSQLGWQSPAKLRPLGAQRV